MKLLVFIILSKLQRKYQNTIVRLHKYHIVQQYVSINKTIKIILQRIVYGLLTQISLQRILKPACKHLRVENRNEFVVSLNSIYSIRSELNWKYTTSMVPLILHTRTLRPFFGVSSTDTTISVWAVSWTSSGCSCSCNPFTFGSSYKNTYTCLRHLFMYKLFSE